jgi:hypothetical protein
MASVGDDSNTDRLELHHQIDRVNDRLKQVDDRCKAHGDEQVEAKKWRQEIDRDMTRIKFLGTIIVALLGLLIGGARWMVSSAVTDALVGHGILQIARK